MRYIIIFSYLVVFFLFSCSEPSSIGLEVQPLSEKIIINNDNYSSITFQVESEDSLINNASSNLLGEINDNIFPNNNASFLTQILLTENNILIQGDITVDSVVLSYSYSGYYGDLVNFTSLEVKRINQDIYIDSNYYSNDFNSSDFSSLSSLVEDYFLSTDTNNPILRINLENEIGEEILTSGYLSDNTSFLEYFKGFFVEAQTNNTVLYLNPSGTNSKFAIYYHDQLDSSYVIEFQLDGDAARVNMFENEVDELILNNQQYIYIESMAGYKSKLSISNIDSLKNILVNKAINKAILTFNIQNDQIGQEFDPHEELFLARIDLSGNVLDMPDFVFEGAPFFGGKLENNKYEFNITRYMHELINNSNYTNQLYLLDKFANINANRTIIDGNIVLTIFYSDL